MTEDGNSKSLKAQGKSIVTDWLKCCDADEKEDVEKRLQKVFYEAMVLKSAEQQRRCMHILSGVQQGRKTQIDPLVYRSTLPIIWRCLESPNDYVRASATKVFLTFYPIIDEEPDDEYLQKQNLALRNLLGDSSLPIRLSVTTGIFNVLRDYWQLIPQEDRAALFSLLGRNATECDASVRKAVYDGIGKLLPVAHAIPMVQKLMKAIVPKGIDDKHYRVRSAAFKLLTELKGHRLIKVFDLITGEHILTRLDLEHNSEVKRSIVKIMTPQFRPKKATDQERVRRLFLLVKSSPRAALMFHRYLYSVEALSLEEAVKHIKMIGMAVYISLKRKLRNVDWEADGIEISESLMNDTAATFSNIPDLPPITDEDGSSEAFQELKHLLDCAIVMLFTIRNDLIDNPEQYTIVNKFLVFFFKKMFITYRKTVLFESIMILGSLLPDEQIGEIASKIVRTLRDIEDDQIDVQPYLTAAVSWKMEELFELIDAGLKSLDMTNRMQQSSHRRTKTTKSIKFTKAVEFLEHVLANPAVTEQTIGTYATTFSRFHEKLKVAKDLISARYEGEESADEDQVICNDEQLIKALRMRAVIAAKLISFLEDETDDIFTGMVDVIRKEAANDVVWFSEIPPPDPENGDAAAALYEKISREMFHLMSIHLQSCSHDIEYVCNVLTLVCGFAEGRAPPSYVVSVLKTMKHLFRTVLSIEDSMESLTLDVLPVLDHVVQWINVGCEEYDELLARDISAAFVSLCSVLFNVPYIVKTKAIYERIEFIFLKLLDEMIAAVFEAGEVVDPADHTFGLPPFSNLYLKRILPRMKTDIQNYFVDILFDFTASGPIVPEDADDFKMVVRIAAGVQLCHFLKVPRSREKELKKAKEFMKTTVTKLNCEDAEARYMKQQLLSIIKF